VLRSDLEQIEQVVKLRTMPFIQQVALDYLNILDSYDQSVQTENRVEAIQNLNTALRDRELLFSPLSLNIPAGKTDYFKLVYIGPKDDQERYYRVIFEENRIKAYDKLNNKDASSQFIPAVSLSTIFIVQPRKQNLKYNFDEQKGYLKNTGNTTFRVIVSQGCEGSDEDATQFYMLPGEEYHNESLKGENRKFLVANKKYIPIGTTCMVE